MGLLHPIHPTHVTVMAAIKGGEITEDDVFEWVAWPPNVERWVERGKARCREEALMRQATAAQRPAKVARRRIQAAPMAAPVRKRARRTGGR